MIKLVVLFNLKKGVEADVYQHWAKTTDLPTVNSLESVNSFEVLKCSNLLGSDLPSPYEYVEIIELADKDLFFKEVSTNTMKNIADEFQTFADNPMFIVSETL
ncbi:REDY-like protein HapK [Paraglaciecola sp. 2405UD69-4]|uniref:REDY-like protein HapK n=1 Tax=Paraglaciecola sp. 2405UD69-4 TaxID=3391836 RepID=UPI0039C9D055